MKQKAITAVTIVAVVLVGAMHGPTPSASADTTDDVFIRDLRFEWGAAKVDPRRDALIAAGHQACDMLRSGMSSSDTADAIQSEYQLQAFVEAAQLVGEAMPLWCPELDPFLPH